MKAGRLSGAQLEVGCNGQAANAQCRTAPVAQGDVLSGPWLVVDRRENETTT